ncbi:hypothetical protein YA0059_23095 [Pseudomonas syringae]|uniref:hypothetical protein n=1 Tax=Pseudomonas syringae TaxID=317 RepID=UPI0018E5E775|nr:hypothetical protein [Pseudomonas syringae]MBI6788577.1 hypothetical protein [Pseudomonas syringae]
MPESIPLVNGQIAAPRSAPGFWLLASGFWLLDQKIIPLFPAACRGESICSNEICVEKIKAGFVDLVILLVIDQAIAHRER